MFLYDWETLFPTDFSLIDKDDKCCKSKHYDAIPYVNCSDITLLMSNALPLELVSVSLILYSAPVPFSFLPLTAGVHYHYRTGTDPDGQWQLQIVMTGELCTLIESFGGVNYIGFAVGYELDGNLQAAVSYEYKHYSCYCNHYVRLCDGRNTWGCIDHYALLQKRAYYGKLDNIVTSDLGLVNSFPNCVVIATRAQEQSPIDSVDYLNEYAVSKETKKFRYTVFEKMIPTFRMFQISNVLAGFLTVESDLTNLDNSSMKVVSEKSFRDIDVTTECRRDMKLELESIECQRAVCSQNLSVQGCKFQLVKSCQSPIQTNITTGLTAAQLTQWNAVTKNTLWQPNATQWKGVLRFVLTGSSPASRAFVASRISTFLTSVQTGGRMFKINNTQSNASLLHYAGWATQINGITTTIVGNTTNVDVVINSENPTLNPIATINDCDTTSIPLVAHDFFIKYPTAKLPAFTGQALITPFVISENRAERITAVAPVGCIPIPVSVAGDNWFFKNKKTGVVYNNLLGTPLSSIGVTVSGGGLIADITLGRPSDFQSFDVTFKNGSITSSVVTVTQTKVF